MTRTSTPLCSTFLQPPPRVGASLVPPRAFPPMSWRSWANTNNEREIHAYRYNCRRVRHAFRPLDQLLSRAHDDQRGRCGSAAFLPIDFRVGTGPFSVDVADLDGDIIPYLVIANRFNRDVSVLLGSGDGAFQAAISLTAVV